MFERGTRGSRNGGAGLSKSAFESCFIEHFSIRSYAAVVRCEDIRLPGLHRDRRRWVLGIPGIRHQEHFMAKSNDHPFISVVPDANAWLDEICDELEFADRRDALHALRAALHVLRDRLSPEQNAHLSAQLPTLIRGIYYEAWRPGEGIHVERRIELYLAEMQRELGNRSELDPFDAARTVYTVVQRHVSEGEIVKLTATLPHQLRILWEPAGTN
jgi:uncharacterized protein (DUF2267 family)